jgi:hypothetical protein
MSRAIPMSHAISMSHAVPMSASAMRPKPVFPNASFSCCKFGINDVRSVPMTIEPQQYLHVNVNDLGVADGRTPSVLSLEALSFVACASVVVLQP